MPTVTLNKTVLERLVGRKLSLEQLKDRISMLGTDLEKIEGNEIVVEVFPNRPDMLSEQGFARALSSFVGAKTGLRKYAVKKSGLKVIVDKSVTMRPFTMCALVRNLTFTDEKIRELMQIQEKLALTHGRNRKKSAYGIYPADRISFPITYIAKDPEKVQFKPLGLNKFISASGVIDEHPKGKAYQHLTTGWTKYPFFIDAADQVMCMLPFTNSEDTGKVELTTKDVFIECTGTDLNNVTIALNIIVTMLADLGGEIHSLEMVYPDKTIVSPNLAPRKMKLPLSYINQRLGLPLTEKQAGQLLAKMGYGYEKSQVLVPAYRADILHQVDLMEDIAIAYGYENFKEEIPNVATIGEEAPVEKFSRKVREILVGLGLLEVKNYHLATKEELNAKMNLPAGLPMNQQEKIIPLKNALGDYNHLRNSLLPSLLKNLAENQHHEYPQNLFEIGRTFFVGGEFRGGKTEDKTGASQTETGITEMEKLGIVVCHEQADFTKVKQVVDALLGALGLKAEVKESVHSSFIPGRVGKIVVKGKEGENEVGIIGEFSPQVLTNWGLEMPVVGMEIDVEKVWKEIK